MYILVVKVSFADFPNKTKIKIILSLISHVLLVLWYFIYGLYHSQGNALYWVLKFPFLTCPPPLVLPASVLIAPTQNITVPPYLHPTWFFSFPTPNSFCFSQSQPAFWFPFFSCNWDFWGSNDSLQEGWSCYLSFLPHLHVLPHPSSGYCQPTVSCSAHSTS